MKVIIAKGGWFTKSDLRLDAAFHLSDGQSTRHYFKEKGVNAKPLDDPQITDKIFYGGRDRRTYVKDPDFGLPFIKGADIVKSDFSNLRFISRKRTAKMDEYFLQEGWTLITRSGTIGNTAYVNKDFLNKAASDDIIRVVPSKIKSGFLYAFLSSKYGQALLKGGTYGAVIQHIEPEHICGLPVPIIPEIKQDKIHDLVIQAANLRVEANHALSLAKNMFNEYEIKKKKSVFQIKSSLLSDSWLGRNNLPEIVEYEMLVKKNGYQTLEWFSERVYAPPMFKHIYLKKDNGYPFFNGTEISRSRRFINSFLSPKGVGDINDYIVKKDTFLIYRHGPRNGMLGNVFIVDEFLNNSCLSDLVIRVESKNRNYAYWMFSFFSTKLGREILHNTASGTAILFLSPNRLKSIKIPFYGEEKIKKNAELIHKYVNNTYQANKLENQAIQIIETEIDQWQQ